MHRLAYTSSLLALMVVAMPAAAQTIATDRSTETPVDPNDIVVTATRHSERLQDVPLSVTAFTQAELTQKGIVGFEGIARDTRRRARSPQRQ